MKHCAIALVLAASCANAGPPGDYGDAPVGNNGQGILAYPGVLARWDTRFNHTNTVFSPQYPQGAWLNPGYTGFLGALAPGVRADSTMTPALPENDCRPVLLFDGPAPPAAGTNPLAQLEVTVSTTPAHNPDEPLYLNVWIDQNRDGKWQDGYFDATPVIAWNLEWVMQDVRVYLAPGTLARVNTAGMRLENPTAPVWVRVMVTDEPVGAAFRGPPTSITHWWDSTMTAAHPFRGEIEDHYLEYQTAQPGTAPVKGVWWRPFHNNPGGAAPPKAACDVFYKGPWRIATPRCLPVVVFPLDYTSSSRNNGCALAPVLWAMYGLKHVAGVPGPPNVSVRPPRPPGSAGAGAPPSFTCPAPFAAVITLPAGPIPNEGALMDSMTLPEASLTGGTLRIQACYPPPPPFPKRLRFRAYRAFFHTQTCGSVHVSRSVFEQPETGLTIAHAVVEGPGYGSDYCDFEHGGLEEDFVDLAENRPFPDPDFTNFAFNLPSPSGSEAVLDPDTFVSPPHSLRLRNASYIVSPAFPDHYEAGMIELSYFGGGPGARMQIVSVEGMTLDVDLPPADDWQSFLMTLPPDFRLQSIVVDNASPLPLRIDDLGIDLREITPPAPPCDPDFNQDGNVDQDDVVYLINVIGGGENPTERDPDFNQDGNVDQDDVTALINAVGGGGCP